MGWNMDNRELRVLAHGSRRAGNGTGDHATASDERSLIYTVPFEAKHFAQMTVKDQEWMQEFTTVGDMKVLESDFAITVMHDGLPLACGGALPYEPHRALAW